MKKRYNIMTSCDDNLAPYVAIGLTAMAYNLKDANIDFFFLHSRVSRKNIEMLKALCGELENGKINFHEILVPHAEIYSELARYGTGWAGEAYYSLCAHLLLPDDVDRVLYLDAGDTMIVGDIEEYYNYDFQGKSLVVTGSRYKVVWGNLELYGAEDLGDWKNTLPPILRGIFNSGSYVMNLDKMRKDGRTLGDYQYLSMTLREIYGENNHNIYWGDQGLLSAAFAGDVRYYGYPEIQSVWYMPYNFCLLFYYEEVEETDIWEETGDYLEEYGYEYGLVPAMRPYLAGEEGIRCGKERCGGVILDFAAAPRYPRTAREEVVYVDLTSDREKERNCIRKNGEIHYVSPLKYLDTIVKTSYDRKIGGFRVDTAIE